MGQSWFDFQQFRIEQDRCAMKISTDAVILGALAETDRPGKILDIGTGTGVIALMLAQRFPDANLVAVELDPEASRQARENFERSPFANRLSLHSSAIQDFQSPELFDLIVSNPPYFTDHLPSSNLQRNRALHTGDLRFEDLASNVDRLLNPKGIFWVILPPRQMKELEKELDHFALFPCRSVEVSDRPEKAPHRVIKAFSYVRKGEVFERLSLKDSSGKYTPEYQALISGFLLGY